MRKLSSISIFLILSAFSGFATGNYSIQWQKGNTYYQQARYDSAAYYFEQIAALKPRNAEVYYNLGNTYYRLNKVAMAVLNYQRALHINPANKDAKDNLAFTENRISNHIQPVADIFFIEWWNNITNATKAGVWAIWALVTFALIMACLLIMRLQKAGHRIPVQLPGILAFICVCFLALAFAASENAIQNNSAVVMQNDAPLMNAEQKGKPLSLVPEGTTVKILGEKGMWAEVTLPDGRNGWLQQSLIEKI